MASSSWSSALAGRLAAFVLAQLDRRNPVSSKLFVLAAIVYAFSPIDFIPDILPGLGFLDDLAIVPLGLFIATKLIPDAVWGDAVEQARREARKWIFLGALVLGCVVLVVGYLAWVVIRGAWVFAVG